MNCKVCGNTSTKSTSVSFFRFPKENKKCRDWAERCGLLALYEKHGTLTFYKSFRICSAHFDPKDIVFDGRKKRLLQSALPSLITTKSTKQGKTNERKNFRQDEMLSLKVVENLCRLCAKENRNLTDIYGCQGRILNLEGKLKYFPLMINRSDVLPLRVCHPCISKVNQFHDFITHCLKAETQLRIMLDLEVCNTSCKLAEMNGDGQEKATQDSLMKTPNLDLSPTVSNLPEFVADFPENIKDNYYGQVLQNNDMNESGRNCLCKRTTFVMQSKSPSEPSFAKAIQLSNHTNCIIETDFNRTVGFEHDYSSVVTRDQLQLESKLQIEDERNLIEGANHPCQMCFESFQSSQSSDANALTNSVQPAMSREFNCEAWNKVFFSRMETDTHISHRTEGELACKICDKKFHEVAFLEEHPLLPPETSCDDISDLRPSQIYLGSDETTRQKDFPEINQRNHVLEKTNLKSRKRRCQYCDRLFKNHQVCLAHEKSHAGETPYQCKQCGKKFRSRPSLRQHGSVHSDKRLYNCQECGLSFKRKDTLSNHFRIHTGERPFVCKVCGFAFKQRGDCSKHEKNHQKCSSKAGMEEKVQQKSQLCDVATDGSVTEDLVKTNLVQALDGLSWNNGENSSLPYFPGAVEIAPLDPLEDLVAGQIISFNFQV